MAHEREEKAMGRPAVGFSRSPRYFADRGERRCSRAGSGGKPTFAPASRYGRLIILLGVTSLASAQGPLAQDQRLAQRRALEALYDAAAQFIPKLDVITGETICNQNPDLHYGSNREYLRECPRSIIDTLAPRLLNKFANTVFLLPAITLLKWHVAPRGWKPLVAAVRKRLRRCPRTAGKSATAATASATTASTATAKPDSGTRLRLDNKLAQYVTWLQVGLIFGPQALVLICFFTDRWTHIQGLRYFGKVETHADVALRYRPTNHWHLPCFASKHSREHSSTAADWQDLRW